MDSIDISTHVGREAVARLAQACRRCRTAATWLTAMGILVSTAMARQETVGTAAPQPLPSDDPPIVGQLRIGAPNPSHPPVIGGKATPQIVRQHIVNIYDSQAELQVVLRRGLLIRTRSNVTRTYVVSPDVADVQQFSPREISIVGKSLGGTHVTFWFDDEKQDPLTVLVRVVPDPELEVRREEQYDILENLINQLFPNSKVQLFPLGERLVVKGQARDSREAAQILAIIRGDRSLGINRQQQSNRGTDTSVSAQTLNTGDRDRGLGGVAVINLLTVPGVEQVALKVRVAELNRSALRRFGVDLDVSIQDKFFIRSLLGGGAGGGASMLGTFDMGNLQFFIHFLEQKGLVRLLSEPTLVTISGSPASFVAGGEFAVPTTVGVAGAQAVTTDFRAFGAILTFLPTIVDKDHVRMQVSSEFSSINQGLAVNGTPGLNTRAVSTNVEMREGQTLAIAGLLSDSINGDKSSDLPWVGNIFGLRHMKREETELIVLVTPEFVHPLEPEEVPPLPGFDVHEPTNWEFYGLGRLEGRADRDYRSGVWPSLRNRFRQSGWQGGGNTGNGAPGGYGPHSGWSTPGVGGCSSCNRHAPGVEIGPGPGRPGNTISGPHGHSNQ